MEVESPRALFNADKDYFLKTIAARRSQLQKQPWFSDYQGYLLNHQGRMYSYTVCQGEERPRIDHIRGLPGTDPLAAFFDEIHLGEKIRVWNAVSSLSRSEMSRHKREGLMDGVNPDLIENLVTDYQEAVTRLLGANPKLIDQPSRILHRIVIQHGIFEMEDIISAVNHYNSTNETETGVTPELRMERSCLLHNAAAVASVYNMGTYMWEKDRRLSAHNSFINSFELLKDCTTELYRLIGFEQPDSTVARLGDLVDRATYIYPPEDLAVGVDPDLVNILMDGEYKTHLSNIVFNLVHNAWKYSSHTEVRDLLSGKSEDWNYQPVMILINQCADSLQIEVIDSGVEIPRNLHARVLEGNQIHSFKSVPSTGKGLASVCRSVERLGGVIEISDEVPEKYTKKFRIVLSLPMQALAYS